MASAKDIVIKPISAKAANALVKRVHYSGKVVNNSKLHLGAFLNGKLEGAMSFGSPLDKRKVLPLVEGTQWNAMLELNRMAFSDVLPRNSESRAMAVAFRMIRKHYPHIEWILSFSDGTQCGDGTIYRAAGFVLTGIKTNSEIWRMPNGDAVATSSLRPGIGTMKHAGLTNGGSSMSAFKAMGAKPIEGFQLKYIYFLNPDALKRLTVPVLPFSKIDEMGAGMYRGKPKRDKQATAPDQGDSGGAAPTVTLHTPETAHA